jgi:hypothetical protein
MFKMETQYAKTNAKSSKAKKTYFPSSHKENNSLVRFSQIGSGHSYRQYLQSNGQSILEKNRELYKNSM